MVLKQICTHFSEFCIIFKCTHIILSKSWLKLHGLWFIHETMSYSSIFKLLSQANFCLFKKGEKKYKLQAGGAEH